VSALANEKCGVYSLDVGLAHRDGGLPAIRLAWPETDALRVLLLVHLGVGGGLVVREERAPITPEKPRLLKHDYGIYLPEKLSALELELFSFRHGIGRGKLFHLHRAIEMLWPKTVWHEWMERRMDGLCRYDFVSWAGAAASGKTFDAALYAMTWYAADPTNSSVVLTSTTGGMVRKRIWGCIQKLYWSCPGYPADLLDATLTLRGKTADGKRNDKAGIFAKPVKEGNTSKSAADIIGLHQPRVLIIVDEAAETPPAIFEAMSNLRVGCEQFQAVAIANPNSRLDEHGKMSTPRKGWSSINLDSTEWETVDQLDGKPGLCQRFDGELCPNVISRERRVPGLMAYEDLESAKRTLGEKDLRYWRMYRGIWAPEGCVNTVLSEPQIIASGAWTGAEPFRFDSQSEIIAGLDPAFGGDDAVLQFARAGVANGEQCLQLLDAVVLHIDATVPTPADLQVAEQARRLCEERQVRPWNFGMDATGTGRGVFAILFRDWSPAINRVEFGGMPSDLPASPSDTRPCKEVYDRMVTELWWWARELVVARRMRGLGKEAIRDFTTRTYDIKSRKYVLQTKDEMRHTYGASPDYADAVSIVVHVARHRGMTRGAGRGVEDQQMGELMNAANRVFENVNYEPEPN
jgi:hypothetical protein